MIEPTLHEALATMGFWSCKENDQQRRTVYDAHGNKIGSFTAAEAWGTLQG